MARIVTTQTHKRPPRRQPSAAALVPAIVTIRSKRRVTKEEAPEATAAKAAAPPSDDRESAIVTARRPGARLRNVPDLSPEEHQRRGDAADALFREIVRRATESHGNVETPPPRKRRRLQK